MEDFITFAAIFGASMAVSLAAVSLGRRLCRDDRAIAYWKRPPITDDQFIRLLSPGVDPVIALKVREIISDVSGVDKKNIYPDARLFGDLGMD